MKLLSRSDSNIQDESPVKRIGASVRSRVGRAIDGRYDAGHFTEDSTAMAL